MSSRSGARTAAPFAALAAAVLVGLLATVPTASSHEVLGTESIPEHTVGWARSASAWADRVAWEDNRTGSRDVYVKNVTTGVETLVAGGTADQLDPDTARDWVVWVEGAAGGPITRVMGKNLATGATRTIQDLAASNGRVNDPDTDGRTVVWVADVGSNDVVYRHDLASGANTVVVSSSPVKETARVSDSFVAWLDYTNRVAPKVAAYNRGTGATTTHGNAVEGFALDGSLLAFADRVGSDPLQVYAKDLATGAAAARVAGDTTRIQKDPSVLRDPSGAWYAWTDLPASGGTTNAAWLRPGFPVKRAEATAQGAREPVLSSIGRVTYLTPRYGDVDVVQTRLDVAAPAVALTLDRAPDFGAWYRSRVNATMTATDAGVGVETRETSLDGAAYAPYSTPIALLPDGVRTLLARSADHAGNLGSEGIRVRVDGTPPTTTASAPCALAGESSWCRAAVSVTLSATDATSGVGSTEIALDAEPLAAYAGPLAVPEGAHTVSYRSTDNAGNAESVRTLAVSVDTARPTTTATITGTPGVSPWLVSEATVALACADPAPGSGCRSTTYNLNGGSTTVYGAPLTLADGTHTLLYRSRDVAANVETDATRTIRVDTRAPVTTAAASCTLAGDNGWCRGSLTITLSATDATSGVARTRWSLDGAAPVVGTSVTIPAGTHTLAWWSEDAAGNVEAQRSATHKVDTERPATTTSLPAADGANGWHLGAVTATLACADPAPASGCRSTLYGLDAAPSIGYSAPFTIATEGTTDLRASSRDLAGNVEPATSTPVRIDLDPPTTTATTTCATPGGSGWCRGGFTVTLAATDAASGVASREHRVDSGEWTPYSSPIAPPAGEHVIGYRSADLAGRVESERTITTRLDAVAPATTATLEGTDGLAGWTVSPVTVTLACADPTPASGCASTTWTVGTTTARYATPFTLAEEGTTTFRYSSTDVAGNAELPRSATVRIDTTPPSTTLTTTCSVPGDAGWCRGALTVTLTASDGASGVARTKYSLGGALPVEYSAPFLAPAGTTSLAYWSEDAAGLVESASGATLRVDTVAPTTTDSLAGTAGLNGWTVSPITVTLACADPAPASGCSTITRYVDSVAQTYTAPFTVTAEGTHSLGYHARDVAGNLESRVTKTLRIDTVAPTTTLTAAGPVLPSGWRSAPATITLTASDASSGVASTLYGLDGAPASTAYAAPFTLAEEGVRAVAFASTDVAGLAEPAKRAIVRLDFNPPSTTVALAGTEGNVARVYRSDVAISLAATDGPGSGVAETWIRFSSHSGYSLYTAPLVMTDEGTYTVSYFSIDIAGRSESAKEVTFRIDKTAPTIALDSPGEGVFHRARTVSVAASASESVFAWSSRVNAEPTRAFTPGGALTVPDGRVAIRIFAEDDAGNVGSALRAIRVKVGPAVVVADPALPYCEERDYEYLSAATAIAASLDGDTIRFCPAAHAGPFEIPASPGNLTLEGIPGANGALPAIVTTDASKPTITVRARDVEITGLRVDGFRASTESNAPAAIFATGADNLLLREVEATRARVGLSLEASDDVRVERSRFLANLGAGIEADDSLDLELVRVRVEDNDEAGIALDGSTFRMTDGSNVEGSLIGLHASGGAGAIDDATFRDNGVGVAAEDLASFEISGSTFERNVQGVRLADVPGAEIRESAFLDNNRAQNPRTANPGIDKSLLADEVGKDGYSVFAERAPRLRIEASTFEDTERAVHAVDAPGARILRNTVLRAGVGVLLERTVATTGEGTVSISENEFGNDLPAPTPKSVAPVDANDYAADGSKKDATPPADAGLGTSRGVGVVLSRSKGAITVSSNAMTSLDVGVRLDRAVGATVASNAVTSPLVVGFEYSDRQSTWNAFSGNTVNGAAFHHRFGGSVTLSNLAITEPRFSNLGQVVISNATAVTITGSTFKDSVSAGLFVYSSGNPAAVDSVYLNDVNASRGSVGFDVVDSVNVRLSNAKAWSNGVGARFSATTTSSRVLASVFGGNGVGVNVTESSTLTIGTSLFADNSVGVDVDRSGSITLDHNAIRGGVNGVRVDQPTGFVTVKQDKNRVGAFSGNSPPTAASAVAIQGALVAVSAERPGPVVQGPTVQGVGILGSKLYDVRAGKATVTATDVTIGGRFASFTMTLASLREAKGEEPADAKSLLAPTGHSFALASEPGGYTFQGPFPDVRFAVPYTDADLAPHGAYEASLALYAYDASEKQWEPLATRSVDATANVARGNAGLELLDAGETLVSLLVNDERALVVHPSGSAPCVHALKGFNTVKAAADEAATAALPTRAIVCPGSYFGGATIAAKDFTLSGWEDASKARIRPVASEQQTQFVLKVTGERVRVDNVTIDRTIASPTATTIGVLVTAPRGFALADAEVKCQATSVLVDRTADARIDRSLLASPLGADGKPQCGIANAHVRLLAAPRAVVANSTLLVAEFGVAVESVGDGLLVENSTIAAVKEGVHVKGEAPAANVPVSSPIPHAVPYPAFTTRGLPEFDPDAIGVEPDATLVPIVNAVSFNALAAPTRIRGNAIAATAAGVFVEGTSPFVTIAGNDVVMEVPWSLSDYYGKANLRGIFVTDSAAGLRVLDNAVRASTLADNDLVGGEVGIEVYDRGATDGAVIDGNLVEDYKFGIGLVSVRKGLVANNTVEGTRFGVFLGNADETTVRANRVTTAERAGVHVGKGSDGARVTANRVESTQREGVAVVSSKDVRVDNNSLALPGDQGIYFDYGADRVQIDRNTVGNATFYAIAGYASDDPYVHNNSVVHPLVAGIVLREGVTDARVAWNGLLGGAFGVILDGAETARANVSRNTIHSARNANVLLENGTHHHVLFGNVLQAGALGVDPLANGGKGAAIFTKANLVVRPTHEGDCTGPAPTPHDNLAWFNAFLGTPSSDHAIECGPIPPGQASMRWNDPARPASKATGNYWSDYKKVVCGEEPESCVDAIPEKVSNPAFCKLNPFVPEGWSHCVGAYPTRVLEPNGAPGGKSLDKRPLSSDMPITGKMVQVVVTKTKMSKLVVEVDVEYAPADPHGLDPSAPVINPGPYEGWEGAKLALAGQPMRFDERAAAGGFADAGAGGVTAKKGSYSSPAVKSSFAGKATSYYAFYSTNEKTTGVAEWETANRFAERELESFLETPEIETIETKFREYFPRGLKAENGVRTTVDWAVLIYPYNVTIAVPGVGTAYQDLSDRDADGGPTAFDEHPSVRKTDFEYLFPVANVPSGRVPVVVRAIGDDGEATASAHFVTMLDYGPGVSSFAKAKLVPAAGDEHNAPYDLEPYSTAAGSPRFARINSITYDSDSKPDDPELVVTSTDLDLSILIKPKSESGTFQYGTKGGKEYFFVDVKKLTTDPEVILEADVDGVSLDAQYGQGVLVADFADPEGKIAGEPLTAHVDMNLNSFSMNATATLGEKHAEFHYFDDRLDVHYTHDPTTYMDLKLRNLNQGTFRGTFTYVDPSTTVDGQFDEKGNVALRVDDDVYMLRGTKVSFTIDGALYECDLEKAGECAAAGLASELLALLPAVKLGTSVATTIADVSAFLDDVADVALKVKTGIVLAQTAITIVDGVTATPSGGMGGGGAEAMNGQYGPRTYFAVGQEARFDAKDGAADERYFGEVRNVPLGKMKADAKLEQQKFFEPKNGRLVMKERATTVGLGVKDVPLYGLDFVIAELMIKGEAAIEVQVVEEPDAAGDMEFAEFNADLEVGVMGVATVDILVAMAEIKAGVSVGLGVSVDDEGEVELTSFRGSATARADWAVGPYNDHWGRKWTCDVIKDVCTVEPASRPEGWRVNPRYYAEDGEPTWLAPAPGSPAVAASAATAGEPGTLVARLAEDVFPEASPALALGPGDLLLLAFVHDNFSKDPKESLEIHATWNDGGGWSTPVPVAATPGRAAFAPALAFDGAGRGVAVWTEIDQTRVAGGAASPSEAAPHTEIAYATFDPVTRAWSAPALLTSDAVLDWHPRLAQGPDGSVVATWIRKPSNVVGIGGDSLGNVDLAADVAYATWDGAAWSTPAVAKSGAKLAERIALSGAGGSVVAAWIEDTDGDSTTRADRDVFAARYAGGAFLPPERLTQDAREDFLAAVAHDADGSAVAAWVSRATGTQDASLAWRPLSASGAWGAAKSGVDVVAAELKGVADARGIPTLLVQEPRANGTAASYLVYDREVDEWSPLRALRHAPNRDAQFSGAVTSANEIVAAFVQMEIRWETEERNATNDPADPDFGKTFTVSMPAPGPSALEVLTHEIATDLSVVALDDALAAVLPEPGDVVNLTAVVTNDGDRAIRGAVARFTVGGADVAPAQVVPRLVAGRSANVTVAWTVPEGALPDVLVQVDAFETIAEDDESDNEDVFRIARADLVVGALDAEPLPDGAMRLVATVANVGSLASPASEVAFNLSKRALESVGSPVEVGRIALPALQPGERAEVSLVAPRASLLPGPHFAFAHADPAGAIEEADEGDNAARTRVKSTPDLKLSADAISTASDLAGANAIRVRVENAAPYASDGVALDVFAGYPWTVDPVEFRYVVDGSTRVARVTTPPIPAFGNVTVSVPYVALPGAIELWAVVDPEDDVLERRESDNVALLDARFLAPLALERLPQDPDAEATPLLLATTLDVVEGRSYVLAMEAERVDGAQSGGGVATFLAEATGARASVVGLAPHGIANASGTYDVTVLAFENGEPVARGAGRYPIDVVRAPLVSISGDANASEGGSVRLSAQGTTHPEGRAITFAWEWWDGTRSEGLDVARDFPESGYYPVTLAVADGVSTTRVTRVLAIANVDPTVDARAAPLPLEEEARAELDALGLDPAAFVTVGTLDAEIRVADAGADDLTIEIDWGDGASETLLSPAEGPWAREEVLEVSHRYPAGVWTWTIRALDGDGGESAWSATVVAVSTMVAQPEAPAGGEDHARPSEPMEGAAAPSPVDAPPRGGSGAGALAVAPVFAAFAWRRRRG